MKKLAILATAALIAFALPHDASARSKKSTATASPTPAASTSSTTAAEKSARPIPYRGTISSVDKSAKTFTILSKNGNTRIFTVTGDTKLVKRAGGDATWSDLTEGAYVTGSGWKKSESTGADGKKTTHYEAKSVKVGEKTAASAPKKS